MQKGLIGWPNQSPKSTSMEPLTVNVPLVASLSAYTLTIPSLPAEQEQLKQEQQKKPSTACSESRKTTALVDLPLRQRRRRSTAAAFFLPLWDIDVSQIGQQRTKMSLFRQYRNRPHALSAGSNRLARSRFASSDPPSDDGSANAAMMPLITKLDKYTNAELKEYRQIFNMFDTDRSGAIGLDELENAIQNLGLDAKQIDVEMLMREADKRGNQQIDFDEFCEVMKATSEKTQSWNGVIKQCFEVFNRHETGFISLKDFEFVLRELGGFQNARLVEEIFAEFDVNNDRIIDFDEFTFLVKSYLTDQDVV